MDGAGAHIVLGRIYPNRLAEMAAAVVGTGLEFWIGFLTCFQRSGGRRFVHFLRPGRIHGFRVWIDRQRITVFGGIRDSIAVPE